MSAPVSAMISLIRLPLGPITSPILSTGIWIEMIRGAFEFTSSRGDGGSSLHHVEDHEARVARLLQRVGEHLARQPGDLHVELDRGDELARARDLEVHVAERVLRAEDVRQRHELALVGDHAHRDAGDRRLDRHARVHQRERRAADAAPSTSSRSSSGRRDTSRSA